MDLSQTNKQKIGASDDETLAAFEDQIEKAINLKVLKGYGTMYKMAMAKAKEVKPCYLSACKNFVRR